MKKHTEIPDVPGLYWLISEGKKSEMVLVRKETEWQGGALVCWSFDGGRRSFIKDGGYLLGPQEPPVTHHIKLSIGDHDNDPWFAEWMRDRGHSVQIQDKKNTPTNIDGVWIFESIYADKMWDFLMQFRREQKEKNQ